MQCLSCAHDNPEAQKFCGNCGAPLRPAATVARLPLPASYTPPHLAQRILTLRSALEGERKLGAEAMHTLLNRFFALALAEVHRYEGTINQFLGDGFMALFGAPIAHEDHARRALLAALGAAEAGTSTTRAATLRGPRAHGGQHGDGGGRQNRRPPAHGLHRRWQHHESGRASAVARRARRNPHQRSHLPRRTPVL